MIRRIAWCLLPLLCLSCWGYHVKWPMPEGFDTIAVEVFTNRTLYREVEFEFTNAVQREISVKTPLKIVGADGADALISGDIVDFRREVLRESQADRPTEYRITLVINYQVKMLKTGEVFAEGKKLRRSADYQLLRGQVEREARQEAIRELARNVVQHAFHRWE